MATLPADRTKLALAQSNQVPGIAAGSAQNKNAITEAYDTIDLLNQKVDGLVGSSTLSPYPPGQYNQLFNGNFDVWQRGTSFSGNNIYTADRWYESIVAGAATITNSRQSFALGQTAVPNNPKYFMRINPTVLTTCTYFVDEQRIEGVDKFAGQTVTVSFWMKADTAQTISAFIRQNFGTGGTPSADAQVIGSNIVLTTAWTKYTVTFNVPSIAGKALGSNGNDYVSFGFNLPQTGSYSIDIAQVQLNLGSIALPFQPRSFADEIALCQRYYEKSGNYTDAVGTGTTVGLAAWQIANNKVSSEMFYKVRKRTTPTVTLYDNVAVSGKVFWIQHGTNSVSLASTVGNNSEVGFTVGSTATDSLAINNVAFAFASDAEL